MGLKYSVSCVVDSPGFIVPFMEQKQSRFSIILKAVGFSE